MGFLTIFVNGYMRVFFGPPEKIKASVGKSPFSNSGRTKRDWCCMP